MNYSLLGLAIGLCFAISNIPTAAADLTTTIDAKSNLGTWEGWGTSLAWWAQAFGTRDDLADIFFTTKTQTFRGKTVPGLGLNIVRYNAGACSTNSYNGSKMAVSPKMMRSREMEGFWHDWASTNPSSSSWNWNVDSAQRNMLWKARDRGADVFELFSNSPMWWMLKNKNPAGSDDGGSDNLQSWNYKDHALYLATVAKYAADNWGFKFQAVDPFNEPSATWWSGKTGTQEGCHFDVATQATVIGNMRAELDSRGLAATIISASDESYYDQAVTTLQELGPAALSRVSRINVHGYQYDKGARDKVRSLATAAGKKLWNSEYGEGDATGQRLASNLLLDFRWLRPTAWVYWQVLDGGGWGLVDADNDAKTVAAVNQKYFVLAQFTRHIRPGMRVLDAGSDYAVAAYDAAARTLVVAAVNWGDAQYLNFDLSRFGTPGVDGALVKRWTTKIGSGGSLYAAASDTYISGKKFWSKFEKNSVQTFEIAGVVL
ncbi:glycoside hydrolase superfamily [Lasiosphaeria miniovina]|uniref:Glycoside hydrolase superfamily n=1 Tax=Lasiosphaeria miniovina TaxID=1954250 RepID=A0AA40AB61_9PEZI|nr:glycoside hydrolase superfamily [Lasiosphaeria miniovina]KAK0712662.1 glycoside hydrolase superfamily [Lasiosphaeria miniovina]